MESITCANTITLALYFLAITSLMAEKSEASSSYEKPLERKIIHGFVPKPTTNTIEFIKSSCGVTLYPDLCYKTLSGYASTIKTSPTQLANAALNVTLRAAQNTSAAVGTMLEARNLKPKEAGALKDCVETLGDSVDELQQSMAAMKYLEGPEFEFQMSNIHTWVSAALTDEDTCTDGFEEVTKKGKVKGIVRGYVVTLAQLTSNALALVNNLN